MKKNKLKTLAIFVFALQTATAMAQPQFYHRVGDTIRGQCPIYYYDWYWDSDSSLSRGDSAATFIKLAENYQRHLTSTPLKVVGIASSMQIFDNFTQTVLFEDSATSVYEDTTNFYILFQATPSGPNELRRVCWTDDMATHPKRYIEYVGGYLPYGDCDNIVPSHYIVPIREYYFDSAVYVTDSFYIGKSRYTVADNYHAISNISRYRYDYLGVYANQSVAPCFINIPVQHFIQRLETSVINGEQNEWQHFNFKDYQLIYPIIEVDTVALAAEYTCQRPSIPEAGEQEGGTVRFRWTATETIRWQLALTPQDGEERIYDAPTQQYTIHGLSPDTTYLVSVRGYCRNKMWEGWGDWSDTLTYTPPQPLGPSAELPLSHSFSLTPNPATSSLLVSAPEEQGTLTVLDIQGRQLFSANLVSGSCTLDISHLPSGTYIVELVPADGSPARRQRFVKQ